MLVKKASGRGRGYDGGGRVFKRRQKEFLGGRCQREGGSEGGGGQKGE